MKLVMRLFTHRGIFYVENNGKRSSLKTRNKDEAKRLYAAYKKQVLAGKVAKIEGRCDKTLKDFADEYVKWAENVQPHSTFRANRLALDKLKHYAGEKTSLDRITLKHIDLMVADLKKLSPRSVNNYIRHSRVVLNKAVDWGYLQSNPLSKVKEIRTEKKPPAFLDRGQAAQFIAGIKDVDLRRLVVAYLVTGRRRAELLKLRWEDVDLAAGKYFVRRPKNQHSRWFGIKGYFRAILEGMEKRTGRVFEKWEHPDTVSHHVKAALVEAGFPNMRLHDLRHSFASIKLMEGATLREVQALLGHESLGATMVYSHLSEEYVVDIPEINLGPIDLQGSREET